MGGKRRRPGSRRTNGWEPPHNLEAERSVLGALLLHPDAVCDITFLRPEDFYLPKHQMVFRSILATFDGHAQTDPIAVEEDLRRRGVLEEVGGREGLLDLLESVVSAASVGHHAELVQEKASMRCLGWAALEIADQAMGAGTVDLDELRTLARARLEAAMDGAPGGIGASPADVLDSWREEGPIVHEPTGIDWLDERTGGGLVYGSRVYVAGAPDAGKTAFIVQIADTYAKRGVPVGFLGVDEEPGDLLQRLAQRRGHSRQRCELREPQDLDAIRDHLAHLPIRFYGAETTIEKAADAVAGLARSLHRRGVLFIDSIQTARAEGETDSSRYETVTARVHAVRAMAKRHGLLLVATSELGRAFYKSVNAAAELDDLAGGKESGAIEYSARLLLSLRSVPGKAGLVELRAPKNKYGPRTAPHEDGLFLSLDRERQSFVPVDYKPPPVDERKAARNRDRDLANAAHIAAVLAGNPGLKNRELRAAARARAGGMSSERFDTARALVGEAVQTRPGARTAVHHYLDGSRVPKAILDRLTDHDRAAVQAATPPADEESGR